MMLLRPFRDVLRQFRRHPLYSFAYIVTLALAVSAGTATMAVVRPALLAPLPYLGGDALVSIYTETQTWEAAPVSPHVVRELSDAAPVAEIVGLEPGGLIYTSGGATRQVLGLEVTPEFFTAVAAPALGRPWAEGETDVVVLSDRFWREELGADPAALGRSVVLGGSARMVVGVLPPVAAPYWPQAEVFTPLDVDALVATLPRTVPELTVVGRLAEGATLEQLNAWLAGYTERVRAEYPDAHGRQRFWAESLRKELVGEAGPVLAGTGLAAALLLLIVCANIAGLSAALGIGIRHRLAVQGALGATRGRLLRERLGQSVLLAMAGAGLGIWMAGPVVAAFTSLQPHFMGRLATVTLEPATAAACFAAGVVIAAFSALVPFAAVIAGRLDPLPSARGTAGGLQLSALRSGLVVAQVALALVLVIGAGLLIRTMRAVADTSLGFRAEGLHTMVTNLPSPRYDSELAQVAFERQVVSELARLPGVTSATASIGMPIVGGARASLTIRGRPGEENRGEVAYMSLAPDFMQVWGMRLLDGRALSAADVDGAPGAILINETTARRYWPEGDAVGARIWVGLSAEPPEGQDWMTVVGVVEDVRQHGPTEDVLPTAFGSTWQYSWPRRDFSVRVAQGAPPPSVEALRGALHRVDPLVPAVQVQRVDEMVANDTARHRLAMLALGFFGAVATVLCAFGLYAVVSLTSRMRRREYAIRLAVGAEPENVRGMVIRQGLVLGAGGVTLGLLLAATGTRVLEGLLLGVSPLDVTTFGAAVTGVLLLAAAAAWGPARSAGRTDPAEILNAD